MNLISEDLMKQELCENATLVCKKGERGLRGKPVPAGFKGEIGTEVLLVHRGKWVHQAQLG